MSAAATPSPGPTRHRVLVVDDHAAMGVSIQLMLAPEHEVQVATAAESALALMAEGRFDLVLCDVMMPGTSGLELYQQVRAADAGAADRFVFMTGGATTPATTAFLATSKRPVLEKPFPVQALLALLGG